MGRSKRLFILGFFLMFLFLQCISVEAFYLEATGENTTKSRIIRIGSGYPILVKYRIRTENTASHWHVKNKPYVDINRIQNGSTIDIVKKTGRNIDYTSYFWLPARNDIYVVVRSGKQKNDWGRSSELVSKLWLTFYYDTNPPGAVSNLKIANGNTISLEDEYGVTKTYTNGNAFQWTGIADNGNRISSYNVRSGIKEYVYSIERLDNNGEITGSISSSDQENGLPKQVNGIPLEDGEYTAKVYAVDIAGNKGPERFITYTMDRTLLPINLPDDPVEIIPDPTDWEKFAIKAKWNPLTDVSGIKEYKVALSHSIDAEPNDLYTVGPEQTEYIFEDIPRMGSDYYLFIKAVDNLGNESAEWTKSEAFKVESPSVVINPIPESSVDTTTGEPGYQIKLEFSLDGEEAPTYYVLTRHNLSDTTEEPVEVTITHEELVNNDYIYIDNTNLKKHGRYRYSVYTINKWGGTSQINQANEVMVKNIPADIEVVNEQGQAYLIELISNQNVFQFKLNSYTDIEGDDLSFKVWHQIGDETKNSGTGSVSNPVITVNLPEEGAGDWWLEVTETADGFTETRTIKGYTYLIDITEPYIDVTLKSRDGLIDYTRKPTNTKDILIGDISINDEAGDTSSGVEGIYIWNGTGENVPDTATYIPYVAIPQTGIKWTLTDGEDGQRIVSIQAVDKAGNQKTINQEIFLDTTPPAAVGSFTHAPEEFYQETAHNSIFVSWQAQDLDEDIVGFVGSYLTGGLETPLDDIELTIEDGVAFGKVSIDIREGAANQVYELKISVIDRAGNKAEDKTYIVAKKAELGAASYLDGGYDKAENSHYLAWQLSDPGTAAGHIMQRVSKKDNGEITVLAEIYPDSNGIFKDSGLNRRSTYNYRLAALNASDDKTYGELVEKTVPNVAPTIPIPNIPQEYGRSEVEFDFTESIDFDGDPVTYTVKFGAGENPTNFTDVEKKGGKFIKDGLHHGQTYTWYVMATDGFTGGTVESEKVRFTVDTNVPALTTEAVQRPYTKQREIKITTDDDLSGIDKVVYKQIDAETNQELITDEEIRLIPETDGSLTGVIGLAEGYYHLHLFAYDAAGNQTQVELNNLQVDRTVPVLEEVLIELEESGGRHITNKRIIPVRFTATDDYSKIAGVYYWYLQNGEPTGEGGFISLSPNLTSFAHNLPLSGENGKEYTLALMVEDRAGNKSAVANTGTVFIDQTPPQVSLAVEGLTTFGNTNYYTDRSEMEVAATAKDEESTVKTIEYAIKSQETGEPITSWGSWSDVIETAELTKGDCYQVVAGATNGVGLVAEAHSQEFIYEPTGPENLTITGPTSALAAGEVGVFRVDSVENESAIVEYCLALGRTAGGTDLSKKIPGNVGGRLLIHTNEPSAEFRVLIPEGNSDGTYYPQVEVINAAGLKSVLDGTGFTVNNAQEKVIAGDHGPYTLYNNRLTGWWRYTGTQEIAGYRYRIIGAEGNPVTTWAETENTEETVEDLSLENGAEYRFEVQAIYTAGGNSASGFSPGIKVDGTAPVITDLLTPEYALSDNIEVNWEGNDDESGISKVQIALGSDYYRTDITGGWMEVTGKTFKLLSAANGEKLKLQNGERYYLTLRLTNGAGLVVEKPAKSITIDDTAPPVPVIYDQGAYINDKQPLEFNWFWTPVDPESGNTEYKWAVLEFGEEIKDARWQEGNEDKKVYLTDFAQEHGKTYYFAVRATNGAGVTSYGISDGIMVDATAPYIPRVKLVDAINLGDPDAAEIHYLTGEEKELGLWIESMDPESQIATYLYTWGSREEVDDKERWESQKSQIELANQEFAGGEVTVFAGECINNAEETSATGYSTGVMRDDSAPQVIDVRGCVTGNLMYFDWDVAPSASPVVKYEVVLVTEDNMNTMPEAGKWFDVGLARSIELDVTDKEDGYYRLLVRAYNAAGTCSRREDNIDEWGISPQITLDRTAPVIEKFNCDKYASSQVNMEFGATDNLSGISAYQYAFGSKTDPVQFTGGWIDIIDENGWIELTLQTDQLPHKTEAYFMVRVKDNVGIWSETKSSEKIIIDHTPPERPEVTCGPYTTAKDMIAGIGLIGNDRESGITHYLLSVAPEPNGEWLTTPEPKPISEFNGELKGMELTEAGAYYLVAKVLNGAGLWSEDSYSEKITVDTIPPEVSFTLAGTEIVLNKPPVRVEYTLSEEADLEFTLTKGDGTGHSYSQLGEAGAGYFTFEESVPDTYTLSVIPTDQAGNIGQERTQIIRVNAPPEIYLPDEIKTTPGKPLTLPATVADPDGEVTEYIWIPGDGGEELSGEEPEYSYTKLGEYTLTLTVKDNDGAVSAAQTKVVVYNTTSGPLYMDEVWSGQHRLYGEVIVPEGINLMILPGTIVLIEKGAAETGYDYGLIVKGNLTAEGSEQGIKIGIESVTTDYWQGIFIEGRAGLENLTVRQAVRGVAVLNKADVSIKDCTFQDNQVGLHVYGTKPFVQNSLFIDNILYAIKEDEGGKPEVIYCHFTGNGYVYYHEELTVITVEQLNQIEGNSGNSE